MLPEVRMARIVDAIGEYRRGELSCQEAAELLGFSERHFRRLRDRYEAEGAEGIIDRRRGRASARRAPVDRIEWVVEPYRTRYFDFTAKHFHEELEKQGFEYGYTWTKSLLQSRGLVSRAPKRSAHRKKRARKPLPGMMLFQDGSTHAWLCGQAPLDLIVTLDDATGEIYSAFLVEEEGTFSSLRGLRELGIEHIPSYSPQGRGRMERVFGTLQGRLPQMLRLAGIDNVADANRYLAEVYVAEHNARFAVEAAEPGDAFVPFVGDLASILSVQEERVVGRDNTVRYAGLVLQIPESRHRQPYVKARVRVHAYQDGTLALFHGPRCLARYDAAGRLQEPIAAVKRWAAEVPSAAQLGGFGRHV